MVDKVKPETIRLLAGHSASGMPAFEELLVEHLRASRYRLLRSPGLVLGLAAGDVVEVQNGGFRLIDRGMNLCIQIFSDSSLSELQRALDPQLGILGGRLDGQTTRVLVYTVPVAAGFQSVERALREIVGKFPGAQWYFGNVYDPTDGRPLNWWL